MATVYLNRTDEEFWEMTLRQVIALIDQWKLIEKNRLIMQKYINDGGDPFNVVTAEDARKKAAEMGDAMW